MQFYHSQWEIRNDSAHSTASVGRDSRLRYDLGRKGLGSSPTGSSAPSSSARHPNREVVELGGRPANRAVVCG
jgi:hypothetical protein